MTTEQFIPQEATADNRGLARALRDMHVALVAEGFTERQSLKIVSEVLRAGIVAKIEGGS